MQVVQDCDPFYGGDVVYVILDMIQNRGGVGVDVCVWVYCVCDRQKVSPVGAMKPVLTTITSYWGKGGRG